jgi:hypothetical protein
MFLVNDTIEQRQSKIRSFAHRNEPVIAILLAAADFEWTVRRAILALGKSPTKVIRHRFQQEKKGGLAAWKEYWKEEVKPRFGTDLASVVPDWEQLYTKSFPLRHKLIHGAQGIVGSNYAERTVETILAASWAVAKFAKDKGEPIYGHSIRRIKPRQ